MPPPFREGREATAQPSDHSQGTRSVVRSITAYLNLILILALGIQPSRQQSSISLNTAQWYVSNSNGSMVLPASVPGGIYSDLRRNHVLRQELLFGKNDLAYRWVGMENWTYTTTFAIDQQIAMSQSVKLVLHGVDTVSTVYMNGEEVGQTDNMFVRYKFDVKPQLKLAGLKNLLVIKFESPIKYAARQSLQSIRRNRGKVIPPYCPSPAQRGECHVNFIRKMQASFSWDWGPAFPSMGIYKSISLEYGNFGLIRDILVDTRRLAPLVPSPMRFRPQAPPQVVISSTIRHNVRPHIPANRSVPYIRAPPYYIALGDRSEPSPLMEEPQRIDITQINQQLMEENWLLKITLVAEMVQPSFAYNIRVEFNLDGVLHYESEHISVVANSEGFIRLGFNLRIDNSRMQVKPWWPNNAGSQPLYKLTARIMPIPPNPPEKIMIPVNERAASNENQQMSLQARSKPLQTPAIPPMVFLATSADPAGQSAQTSEKSIWFGFRTVELIQEPITRGNLDDGLTFNFRINGVDMFAMGSNWIPASILPENSNDIEHVRYLLESAKDANMNMLRVWGGGIYESDEFYRLADELGIMIWHDFMFACALYPVEESFLASTRLEIEQQVQRLQYHPSIVLWAGNNENEMAIAGPWWPEVMIWSKQLRESYAKLYTETIRPIVSVLDPTRPYVESSPSNGVMSERQPNSISRTPNENKYGDVHHYDYLTDSFDWTVYPSTRFASEYGFQSYPSLNALASVTSPSDWKYPLTSNILHRQHRLTGETEIKLQMKVHFSDIKPGGLDKLRSFVYVSQLAQAIAIKTETEFYRRNRFIDPETKLGKTMGALYWQLNDVWQAPTWSSIEYGGNWKMLHYFARRFFFPIHVVPYVVQPSSIASQLMSMSEQLGSKFDSLLHQHGQQQQQQGQQSQAAQANGPQLVIDLVRDDPFDLVDAFNVTVRFFRWTAFTAVWQETIYIRNTQPRNVTRIYEQDMARILRQPGMVSLSSGVFQVLIEQQPRLGLSQIENYLMPVAPNKVTAMRVAKINVEHVEGPFELSEPRTRNRRDQGDELGGPTRPHHVKPIFESLRMQPMWACAYRLTLVSDSIAMFVWLELNFRNGSSAQSTSQTNAGGQEQSAAAAAEGQQAPPSGGGTAPTNIHLDALPPQALIHHGLEAARPIHSAPEHIRINMQRQQQQQQMQQPGVNREMFETLSEGAESRIDGPERVAAGARAESEQTLAAAAAAAADQRLDHQEQHHHQRGAAFWPYGPTRTKRHLEFQPPRPEMPQPPRRIVLASANDNAHQPDGQFGASQIRSQHSHSSRFSFDQEKAQQHQLYQRPAPTAAFRPVDASGGNLLRYQFSDNAFNMFEPSKVVDLYLSRCLSKSQVEVLLEVQSMADNL